jgi:hypothetical protein
LPDEVGVQVADGGVLLQVVEDVPQLVRFVVEVFGVAQDEFVVFGGVVGV